MLSGQWEVRLGLRPSDRVVQIGTWVATLGNRPHQHCLAKTPWWTEASTAGALHSGADIGLDLHDCLRTRHRNDAREA